MKSVPGIEEGVEFLFLCNAVCYSERKAKFLKSQFYHILCSTLSTELTSEK